MSVKTQLLAFIDLIWPLLEEKNNPYLTVFEKIGEEMGEWLEAHQIGTKQDLLSETADLIVTSLSSPISFSSSKEDLKNHISKLDLHITTLVDYNKLFSEFVLRYSALAKTQRKWRKDPLKYQKEVIDLGINLVLCALSIFVSLASDEEAMNHLVTSKINKWKSYDPPGVFTLKDEELVEQINKSKLGDFSTSLLEISLFDTQWSFLSNFYMSPITYHGRQYPTVEHAYQAAKVTDPGKHEVVRTAATPGEAKIFGRKYKDNIDFESFKLQIMEDLVRIKFFQNKYLKNMLRLTGDAILAEGNSWGDTFWGVCNGVGENHLGKILMKIRSEL